MDYDCYDHHGVCEVQGALKISPNVPVEARTQNNQWIRRIINPLKWWSLQINLFTCYFVAHFVSLRQIVLGCIQSSHKRSVRERGCLKMVSSQIPPQLKLLLRFREKTKVFIPYCPMRNSKKWWDLFHLAHFNFPTSFPLEERACKRPKGPCSRDTLPSPGPRYYWSEGEDGCRKQKSSRQSLFWWKIDSSLMKAPGN